MKPIVASAVALGVVLGCAVTSQAADWIKEPNVWGIQGGIKFGITPGMVNDQPGGPDGLICLGYPTAPDHSYELINYVAVEPTAGGKLSQSELQHVHFSADEPQEVQVDGGVAQLNVVIRPDKFENQAHVSVICSIREDHPNEVRFRIHKEDDSAALSIVNLTATMGNKERVREVHFKSRTVTTQGEFPGFAGDGFKEGPEVPADQLETLANGDWIVRFNTDEENPGDVLWAPGPWIYRGPKISQYWVKPHTSPHKNLRFRYNARAVYWHLPGEEVFDIPNGAAFENLDMRDDFAQDEDFVYGIDMPGSAAK